MSNAKQTMEEALASAKATRKAQKKYAKQHATHFARIASGLKPIEEYLIRINLDGVSCVDISIAGDHHVMNGAWGALRKLGYECSDRPEEKVTGFTGWFYKSEWPTIWFNFNSTVCTRKKVGTKMIEQDVYEVVCE